MILVLHGYQDFAKPRWVKLVLWEAVPAHRRPPIVQPSHRQGFLRQNDELDTAMLCQLTLCSEPLVFLEAIGSKLRNTHLGVHADSSTVFTSQHVVTDQQLGPDDLNAFLLAVGSDVSVLTRLITGVFQQYHDQNGSSSVSTFAKPLCWSRLES